MKKAFEIGGVVASVVLIAFGIAAIVMGFNGRSTVNDSLKQEQITGTPDMTPAAIRAEMQQAGLTGVKAPSCSVAGQPVDSGAPARCFAQYMRIHALEATGGKTYAQMPRYATANGKGTDDPKAAQKRPDGTPVDNPANFNYAPVAVGVVVLFAGGWWVLSAKNWFKGPKVQGSDEELAMIERDLEMAETTG